MQISDLKVGQQARVVKIDSNTPDKLYRQKLQALGMIPGTLFKVAGMAPLGDPIEIEVRGMMLCLRKKEANIIQIEAV